jgi:hypothetical protein
MRVIGVLICVEWCSDDISSTIAPRMPTVVRWLCRQKIFLRSVENHANASAAIALSFALSSHKVMYEIGDATSRPRRGQSYGFE